MTDVVVRGRVVIAVTICTGSRHSSPNALGGG